MKTVLVAGLAAGEYLPLSCLNNFVQYLLFKKVPRIFFKISQIILAEKNENLSLISIQLLLKLAW